MKWDGKLLEDVVKERLYSLLWKMDITKALTMSNKEYAAFLKSVHSNIYCNASAGGGDMPTIIGRASGIIIEFTDRTFDEGDNIIELSWSMAARHIRAWEFEKNQENKPQFCDNCINSDENCLLPICSDKCISYTEKPQSKIRRQWDETHLCGDYHGEHCEYLVQAMDNTIINGKKLDKWCPYCTSENKVRKIGSAGSWTGISPKFCTKRKALENKEDNMARKMQFDAAIAKDMQSAASDSFMDNIKLIDIDEITPSEENFYEISDIDLLADDIEREGLKHNLVVIKDGDGYRIKSGHRRFAAIKLLIEQKRRSNTKIPCYVDGNKTAAEAQFDLIMLNATQRKYTDADVLHEYEEIERTFKELEAEGKPLKGRIRDNIAAVLKVSPAQVGKIENIKHNAISEVEQAVKSGEMSISTANEIAKLPEEKQQKIVKENPKVTHKEVKEAQKQEKLPKLPEPSKSLKSVKREEPETDPFEDEDTLDDEDIGDDIADEPTVKSEKESSLTYSLILSDDEIRELLDFITDNIAYADDEESISSIFNKLRTILGK